jgi:hypothetical protein
MERSRLGSALDRSGGHAGNDLPLENSAPSSLEPSDPALHAERAMDPAARTAIAKAPRREVPNLMRTSDVWTAGAIEVVAMKRFISG